ncbi:hypothetical protein UY3_03942 [Chelonia mydas]|uniref:Uncharacterized protein n=1 Tax=Chelonia mydas TaxID=8469 RepID=M7C336_CHEMY|nr:hypothetical protein UY3_03942 [Chelonia mydas]
MLFCLFSSRAKYLYRRTLDLRLPDPDWHGRRQEEHRAFMDDWTQEPQQLEPGRDETIFSTGDHRSTQAFMSVRKRTRSRVTENPVAMVQSDMKVKKCMGGMDHRSHCTPHQYLAQAGEANDPTSGPNLVMNPGHVPPEVCCAYAKKKPAIG